jgi:hypothetical protein
MGPFAFVVDVENSSSRRLDGTAMSRLSPEYWARFMSLHRPDDVVLSRPVFSREHSL